MESQIGNGFVSLVNAFPDHGNDDWFCRNGFLALWFDLLPHTHDESGLTKKYIAKFHASNKILMISKNPLDLSDIAWQS